jgi:hypothetical protein
MTSGVPLSSLATGVVWLAGVGNTVELGIGRLVFVYQRGTTTQVPVYSAQTLVGSPVTQPLTSDATAGTIPGYIGAGQPIDFLDVVTGQRAQAEPLSIADLIGTDGKIGGAGSVGMPQTVVTDASGHGTVDWGVTKEAPLNPMWVEYGAKGDGSTDDTAAIQAAVDTGGPVFLPPGNFKHSGLVLPYAANGQRLFGAGAGLHGAAQSALTYTGTGYAITLGGGTVGNFTRYQFIEDLLLYGNSSCEGGIRFFSTRWCGARRCYIQNFTASGSTGVILDADATLQYPNYFNRVEDCAFDTMAWGVYLRGEATAGTGANSNIVTGCSFNDCATNGVMVDGGDTNRLEYNEFAGGTGTGIRIGANSAALYNTALANQFDGCTAGIAIDASSTQAQLLYNTGPDYSVTDAGTGTIRRDLSTNGASAFFSGVTAITDAMFPVTPPDGMTAVHYASSKAYFSVRANGTWHVMAGPV